MKSLTLLTNTGQRVTTPTVLQMEAIECGAASLCIILGFHGRFLPLEEVRVACGVSRDGSKASNVLKAARKYGLIGKGYRKETLEELKKMDLPLIIFWNFNHFLVLEGFKKNRVFLNDPATGPRTVSVQEFDENFTGVVLSFKPAQDFQKGGVRPSLFLSLKSRLSGSWLALFFCFLTGLLLVFPGLLIPAFTRVFVDHVLLAQMSHWLPPLLMGMLFASLLRSVLTWIQQYYLLRLSSKFDILTTFRSFWHVLRLPVSFYLQRYAADIQLRIDACNRVAATVAGPLANAVLDMISVLFFGLALFIYDWQLALVAYQAAFINFFAFRKTSRSRIDLNHSYLHEFAWMMGVSSSGLQTIETIKASGTESDFFTRWAGYHAKAFNVAQKLALPSRALLSLPIFQDAFTSALVLFLGAWKIMAGEMTIGTLVGFQSLVTLFLSPLNRFVMLGSQLQNLEGDLARLDDILNNPIDKKFLHVEKTAGEKLAGKLEVKNLAFGYSPLDPPLVSSLSMTLNPGQRVALVGSSGSGKSTLAKLICGLYEPWEGEILFDGKPVSEIPRQVFHLSLSFVDQDILLFEGTVRDNLLLWNENISENQMIHACKDACIHEDIMKRRGGYDGKVDENGINFSGGQRQRLEIARAVAANPALLVLDEATSALDAETEKNIDQNLRRRGCACLIVAHRLSTIRDCNEIIVLDKGKVVDRGKHEELLSKGGLYTKLIRTM